MDDTPVIWSPCWGWSPNDQRVTSGSQFPHRGQVHTNGTRRTLPTLSVYSHDRFNCFCWLCVVVNRAHGCGVLLHVSMCHPVLMTQQVLEVTVAHTEETNHWVSRAVANTDAGLYSPPTTIPSFSFYWIKRIGLNGELQPLNIIPLAARNNRSLFRSEEQNPELVVKSKFTTLEWVLGSGCSWPW